MEDRSLTDPERYPLLDAAGDKLLRAMHEHPAAPRFNHRCGDRLTAEGLRKGIEFENSISRDAPTVNGKPAWLDSHVEFCLGDVPLYKNRPRVNRFEELPTCSRADLARELWSFVPLSANLQDLITYETTGTTGHHVLVPSHPDVNTKYLGLLRSTLVRMGIHLKGGAGKVPMILVCSQRSTFTFASLAYYLEGSGYIKINLRPHGWRSPDDRQAYLAQWQPEVISGDPIALQELMELKPAVKPKAIVSTTMALLPGLRQQLEEHFGCPILDLYSMNECRFIAADLGQGYEIVAPDLYVEILDADGNVCPAGTRGEIVVTGGRNPFLQLLRYRTGDYAALDLSGRRPCLKQLEGRKPIVFQSADGQSLNNNDVSQALRHLPLSQFMLRQKRDRTLVFRARAAAYLEKEIRLTIGTLFGPEIPLSIAELTDADTRNGKVIAYDLADD